MKLLKNLLVIPFYKNENYIFNIGKYFLENPDEKELFVEILIINDCPKSEDEVILKNACNEFGFKYIGNEQNIGFLLSANVGIERALELNSHVIILNSDTLPTAGCFKELISVFEYDDMVACACPRSNNATVANLWPEPIYIESDNDLTSLMEDGKKIIKKLPKVTYSPIVNGFCFAIRNDVIRVFGGFDVDFSPGYEEENEYCLRVSESGFKVAIANWSFVGHLEGKSFSLKPGRSKLMQDHHKMINELYPYYLDRVQSFFSSIEKKAFDLYVWNVGNKKRKSILIDARTLDTHFNGTMKVIKDVVTEACNSGLDVHLIANNSAVKFHNLDSLNNLVVIDFPRRYYDFGLKIGQPFEYHSLLTVPLFSRCSACIFFDTISVDCINLYSSETDEYWSWLDSLNDIVFFISNQSKNQFIKRYKPTKSEAVAALLPIDIKQFNENFESVINCEYSFVVGNNFKHKGVYSSLMQLPRVRDMKYVVLSDDLNVGREDVMYLKPGTLSDYDIKSLYSNCRCVIFPTFSEGFGYPILEALRHSKEIYCRPLLAFKEIYSALPVGLQTLIKFTNDFGAIEITSKDAENISYDSSISIKGYFSILLLELENKLDKISYVNVYDRLKMADVLLRLYSKSKINTTLDFRAGNISTLILFYNILYKFRFMRPILNVAKRLYRVKLKFN